MALPDLFLPEPAPVVTADRLITRPWLLLLQALVKRVTTLVVLTTEVSGVLPIANGGGVSGTYTPTLTGVANVAASSAAIAQWLRVGSVVTVSGTVTVDPTAAGLTQLGISLPVASAFTLAAQCAGVAAAPGVAGQCAAIVGDATTDRAELRWTAVDVTSQLWAFTFTYEVL
jgi:hypothetical protein